MSSTSAPACRSILAVRRGLDNALSSRPHFLTPNPSLQHVRHAQHKQQAAVNGTKDGAGRRLGAKKLNDEFVIPGQIIYRQRGSTWHAGENVGRGRDHTIYATQPGYVKYYRNPQLNPKKRYIGVVLHKGQTLPSSPTAPRVRRLGMVARARTAHREFTAGELAPEVQKEAPVTLIPPILAPTGPSKQDAQISLRLTDDEVRNLKRGKDGAYRQTIYEIGRAAERAGLDRKLPHHSRFEDRQRYKLERRESKQRAKVTRKITNMAKTPRGRRMLAKRRK